MALILSIAGSPSAPSRTSAVVQYAADYLTRHGEGIETSLINARDLDAVELLHGRFDGGTVMAASAMVSEADGIVLATPVYKASYTGVLKAFLDVLPQGAFSGKVVLPIALGGSLAHSLVIDTAIRSVCAALHTYHTLGGLYLIDAHIDHVEGKMTGFNVPETEHRVHAALDQFLVAVRRSKS